MMHVRDIMSTPVATVTSDASIAEAAVTMTARGFTTLPVVDAVGQLLGLVTEADLVQARYPFDPRSGGDPDTGVMLGGHARTAGAVMRSPGACTEPATDLLDLANRMIETRARSVLVLTGGTVVGIVTFQDVLRAVGGARLAQPFQGNL
jgi:CBS domain-containing protein